MSPTDAGDDNIPVGLIQGLNEMVYLESWHTVGA